MACQVRAVHLTLSCVFSDHGLARRQLLLSGAIVPMLRTMQARSRGFTWPPGEGRRCVLDILALQGDSSCGTPMLPSFHKTSNHINSDMAHSVIFGLA